MFKIKLRRTPINAEFETYEFNIGTFDLVSPEAILHILNNLDKADVRKVIISTVGNISFLQTFLRGKSLSEYKLTIKNHGVTM